MRQINRVPLLILCCFFALSATGQEQDLGFRGEVGLRYRINKKSNFDVSYRLDLKENISQFRRGNFSFAYDRKLAKRLNVELYYRFITNNERDKHRFRIALSADKKIFKKMKIEFRTLLQHDMNYLSGDYIQEYKPRFVWRNRIKLDRKINKRWSANLYTEPFISQNYKGTYLYRIRTGTTLSYSKKRWKYSAEYFYQSEFHFEQSGLHIIGLGARYDVTRVIRPKKKKSKKRVREPKK
jgi:hypothetical protein